MKRFSLFLYITLSLPSIETIAQDPVQLNIVYDFTHMRDMSNRANPYTARMVLSVGGLSARYCTEEAFNDNNIQILTERKKQQEKMQATTTSATMVMGGPMLQVGKYGAINHEEIYTNRRNMFMQVAGRLGFKEYYYTTFIPQIKWVLQNDKKKVVGYSCQKAVGEYAGRKYEVWFAPDLAYNTGPWKLSGLPGLILEACDSKNEVSFVAKEITRNTNTKELTGSYLRTERSVNITEKQYVQAKSAFEKDPEAMAGAQFPNVKMMIVNRDNSKEKNVLKIKKYNPIELK